MARVVLFHSAQGLRPAVLEWARGFEDAGHEVWAPDLFDGETFDDLQDGIARRDEIGIPELMRRAEASLAGLPEDLVYAGFSMGAATAGYYCATRPGARGAILMHGVPPLADYGVDAWPEGVPIQIHYAAEDPYAGADALPGFESLVTAGPAPIEVFTYPGSSHLFSDRDSPEADAAAADLMFERVLAFLTEKPPIWGVQLKDPSIAADEGPEGVPGGPVLGRRLTSPASKSMASALAYGRRFTIRAP